MKKNFESLGYTSSLIHQNSPLAKRRGQDSFSFDGNLLDTGLNSTNVKPAGPNQSIQFNNNGTVSGDGRLSFNFAGAALTIGATGFDGFIFSPVSLSIFPQSNLHLYSGTGGDFQILTNGGNGGTSERIKISTEGSITINEQGNPTDLRIEGDNDQNLLFIDASVDSIGIGIDTPQTKLDVSGTIAIQGGNPGAGKVLTAVDSYGIAEWQTPAGTFVPYTGANDNVDLGTFNINAGSATVLAGDSGSTAKVGGAIFNHFIDVGNVGTGEDDLYTDTIAANTLSTNGDRLSGNYAGIFVSSATATRRLRLYFGGSLVYDSTALSLSVSADWSAKVEVMRDSGTSVRTCVAVNTTTASSAPYTSYTRIVGFDPTTTNILKVTGESAGVGAATNDIVAKFANISWFPAA